MPEIKAKLNNSYPYMWMDTVGCPTIIFNPEAILAHSLLNNIVFSFIINLITFALSFS